LARRLRSLVMRRARRPYRAVTILHGRAATSAITNDVQGDPLMASIDSMNALLVDELRDIYDAEKRITKALPKLAKKVSNDDLRSALEQHLQETEGQVSRLEEAFEHLGEPAKANPCAGMRGILEEGDEHAGEDYEDDDLRDAVIIGSAQRVEHYEIAA